MSLKIVKTGSLRGLAKEAVFLSIISEFEFIFQRKHRIRDADVESQCQSTIEIDESSEDYLLNQKERDKALEELRKKLDHYLIGPFSQDRQEFVDRFIESHSCANAINTDLCLAFFNCLLDNNFTQFNLSGRTKHWHRLHVIEILDLLPVITKRCPDLKTLCLMHSCLI